MNQTIKNNIRKAIFLCVFSFQLFVLSSAQEKFKSKKEVVEYTNNIYGNDNILISGNLYIQKSVSAEGNPYLISDKFTKSTVYIRNRKYENILLRYNINEDQFVLKTKLKSGITAYIILNNNTDSVYYSEKLFVPSSRIRTSGISGGYYEKINYGNITFFIKYIKTLIITDPNTIHYSAINRNYLILSQGKLLPLNYKRAFLNYFEKDKKKIRRYFKKNNLKYRTCDTEQLKKLIKYCYDIQN